MVEARTGIFETEETKSGRRGAPRAELADPEICLAGPEYPVCPGGGLTRPGDGSGLAVDEEARSCGLNK